MSGGITQLVATGVQDMYLSGNPEISFFRSSYKRYTHFASNVERQLIQGTPGPTGISTVRFEKKGDLLSHVYLTALDPNLASNVNVSWSSVISKLELMIGGQIVDTQDFTWSSNIEPVYGAQTWSTRASKDDQASSVFFPLKFFFCKDWQNALPLVALQYHDVEIRITWANPNASDQYALWARFIYLDKEEREWFAKKQHDMLIQQVTRVPMSAQSTYEFALSQPIKYIAFESNAYTNVYNTGFNAVSSMNFQTVTTGFGLVKGFQAIIPGISAPAYITAVNGENMTIGFSTPQVIPAITPGLDVQFGLLTLQSTSSLVATTSPQTLTFAGDIKTTYGADAFSGTALISSEPGSITVTSTAYNAVSNVTSVVLTFAGTPVVATTPYVMFVPTGASIGTVNTTIAANSTTPQNLVANTALFSSAAEVLGLAVAIPQLLVGSNTTTSISGWNSTSNVKLSFTATTYPAITGSATVTSAQYFVLYQDSLTVASYSPGVNQGSLAASYMQFKMQINGNDIGESRHLPHWQDINQYYLSPFGYDSTTPNNVVVIPFCLDTSKLQPTGTLNFSRIDTFRLITPTQTNFQQLSRFGVGSYFYAVNYNILRIQNGMAGILYSS